MKKIITFCFLITCCNLHSFAQLQREDMEKLAVATANIARYYVDTVNVHKLVEDAIVGMLEKLDPHSAYTNAADTKKFNEPIQGSFDGIGVQFNMLEDTVLVIQPVLKGPSEKAGIMAGDRIISCNDTILAGVKMSRDNIMHHLRGPRGSIARLGVKRDGVSETMYFNVIRDKIPVNTVDAAYMVTPTIGLIRFSSFGQTTHKEVLEAMQKLQRKGMQSLILDLSQNGGGLLNVAADIASEFLPDNSLVVYTEGRTVPGRKFYSNGNAHFPVGKVAVLVDESTASAAEILSGALQDYDRGTIIGRRTFGKGLVQWPIDLPDGSMIRLTISKYYTPSGRCIQKPYEKGNKKEYNKDLINRYNKGELTNADSIHFPDSLRYKTLIQGRTVYGGGGIMPDYFVPLDTTRYTKFYREVFARGIVNECGIRFLDKNRKKLREQYPDFDEYKASYEVPESLIKTIYSEAKKKEVKTEDEDAEKTSKLLHQVLKALIARDLWDMSEYFSIIYEDDALVQKAVEVLTQ